MVSSILPPEPPAEEKTKTQTKKISSKEDLDSYFKISSSDNISNDSRTSEGVPKKILGIFKKKEKKVEPELTPNLLADIEEKKSNKKTDSSLTNEDLDNIRAALGITKKKNSIQKNFEESLEPLKKLDVSSDDFTKEVKTASSLFRKKEKPKKRERRPVVMKEALSSAEKYFSMLEKQAIKDQEELINHVKKSVEKSKNPDVDKKVIAKTEKSLKKQLTSHKKQLSTFANEHKVKIKAEHRKLIKENEKLEKKLKALDKKVEKQKANLKKISKGKAELLALKKEAENTKKSREKNKAKIEQEKDRISKLKDNKLKLQNNISLMNNELASLEKSFVSAKKEYDKKMQDYDKSIHSSKKELDNLRQESITVLAKLENKQKELEEKEKVIQNRLSDEKKILDTLSAPDSTTDFNDSALGVTDSQFETSDNDDFSLGINNSEFSKIGNDEFSGEVEEPVKEEVSSESPFLTEPSVGESVTDVEPVVSDDAKSSVPNDNFSDKISDCKMLLDEEKYDDAKLLYNELRNELMTAKLQEDRKIQITSELHELYDEICLKIIRG